MKTFIVAMLCGLALTASGKNRIGVKGGYASTNGAYRGEHPYTDGNKSQSNYSFGFSFDHTFISGINVGAEILFEKRGYTPNFFMLPVAKYSYLSVPLKAGYKLGNNFYGFANMGIIPAWLTKSTYAQSATASIPTSSIDLTKDMERINLAGMVEAGFGFKIAQRMSINFSGRYQQSFTNSSPKGQSVYYGPFPALWLSGATAFVGLNLDL